MHNKESIGIVLVCTNIIPFVICAVTTSKRWIENRKLILESGIQIARKACTAVAPLRKMSIKSWGTSKEADHYTKGKDEDGVG